MAAGWLRSHHTEDWIQFPATMNKTNSMMSVSFHVLGSVQKSIFWGRFSEFSEDADADEDIDLGPRYPRWHSSSVGESEWDSKDLIWKWRFLGMGYAETPNSDGFQLSFVLLPYWSIAIPLTALAAILLLSKPRQAIQKNFPDPVQNDGEGVIHERIQ